MTLEELTAQREALLAARFRGVRTVEIEGRRVTYASDAEMATAITDLERRIAAAHEGGRRRRILTSASKGL
ncbi:MAG: phage head-tail joining protein [Hyphomicrobium sp.]